MTLGFFVYFFSMKFICLLLMLMPLSLIVQETTFRR